MKPRKLTDSLRLVVSIMVVSALAAASSGAEPSAPRGGVITGRATDVAGVGVPFVKVYLRGTKRGTTSDLHGGFTIVDLNPGPYVVRVSAIGYRSVEPADVMVHGDSTTIVNFTMHSPREDDPPVQFRNYTALPDSALELKIVARPGETMRFRRKGRVPIIDGTLRNAGPDTVVLVLPGDVHRTPILRWVVRARDGRKLPPQPVGYCGNRSPLQQGAIVTLAPGEARDLSLGFPIFFQYERDTYVVQLIYENRPSMLGGEPLGVDDPEAVRQLRGSTPCRILSNQLVVKVRP